MALLQSFAMAVECRISQKSNLCIVSRNSQLTCKNLWRNVSLRVVEAIALANLLNHNRKCNKTRDIKAIIRRLNDRVFVSQTSKLQTVTVSDEIKTNKTNNPEWSLANWK